LKGFVEFLSHIPSSTVKFFFMEDWKVRPLMPNSSSVKIRFQRDPFHTSKIDKKVDCLKLWSWLCSQALFNVLFNELKRIGEWTSEKEWIIFFLPKILRLQSRQRDVYIKWNEFITRFRLVLGKRPSNYFVSVNHWLFANHQAIISF
jgi:hypothetical protein